MRPPPPLSRGLRALAWLCLTAAAASVLRAQTTVDATWLGGIGNANILGNWLGVGAVPSNGNLGFNYRWIVNGSAASPATVNVTASAAVQALTLSSNATVNLANAVVLTLAAAANPAVSNNGVLSLSGTSNNTDVVISGGTATFSGTGSLTLGNSSVNRVYGTGTAPTLINSAGHTIQGSGQLGVGLLTLSNQGSIVANQSTSLVIDPNAGGLTNSAGGVVRATNGATLVLQNGTVTNTGGFITADDNSHVSFSASTIVGGTLSSVGSGNIPALNNSTLSTLTVAAGSNIEIPNAQRLNLTGTITNAGTIKLLGTANNTDLVASSAATLTGGGAITLSNSSVNRIYGASSTTTLINENNTISGTGQIGANQLQLDNRGTVDANVSGGTLTLDPSGSGVTNTGTLRASNGGTLRLQGGTFTNTGGTLLAQTGSLVDFASGTDFVGGNLATAGTGLLRNISDVSLANVTLTTGSALQGLNGTLMTLTGTFANNGVVSLNGIANNTDFMAGAGGLTLDGGGQIVLSNSSVNRIYAVNGTTTLVNLNNTIHGAGQIGAAQLQFDNRHLVDADIAGATLKLVTSGSGTTNTGTLRASNGGTLRIDGSAVTNTGGTIDVQNSSFVDVAGSTITGGQFSASGSGLIRNVSSSTFNNVTFGSMVSFNLLNATVATFGGTLTNAGMINLQGTANNTDFIAGPGGLTLTGGGQITLSNSSVNRIYGSNGITTLTNLNETISGVGQIGAGQLQLDNRHVIDANVTGGTLTLNVSGLGMTNTGTVRATNGGIAKFQGPGFDNTGGTITASGTGSRVDLDSATIIGGQMTTALGGTIRDLNSAALIGVTLLGTLDMPNATTLTLSSGFSNAGVINLFGTANNTDLIIGAGGLSLTGSGTIQMSNSSVNRIYGVNATTTLTTVDNPIYGAGQIGANQLQIHNQSMIQATFAGSTLTIDPSGTGLANDGTLQASNGAILRLQDGTFTSSAGGLLNAFGPASRIDFASATIAGGTLVGDGVFRVASASTLQGVAIASGTGLQLPNAVQLTLLGTLSNSGTVSLLGSANNTDLIAGAGGATLTGGGEVSLSNSSVNRIYGANGSTALNNVDNTIRGSGQIGLNQLILNNTGTIEANQSAPLTVDLSNPTPFMNQGILRATNGANLVFVDALINSGGVFVQSGSTFTSQAAFTQTGGVTSLQSGTFTSASAALQSGVLQGSGTINGAVSNGGVIAPGANGSGVGIGALAFNQTLTLTSTSLLHLELGGPAAFDTISAPSIGLNGLLVVSFANGFEFSVQPGQTFTLLSTTNPSGLTGTFTGFANGSRFVTADGLGSFQLNYSGNALVLSQFEPLAVPEPSTYALLACGAGLIFVVRRRREPGHCRANLGCVGARGK